MAVEIPSTAITLLRRHFLRSRPILSGSAAANRQGGARGVIAQANHVYSNAMQILDSGSRFEGGDTLTVFYTALVGAQQATEPVLCKLAAGFTKIHLWADAEDCTLQLNAGADNNTVLSAGRNLVEISVTLSDSSGVEALVWVDLTKTASTGYLYQYEIRGLA